VGEEKNELPEEMTLPVLAIRDTVVFPASVTAINVGRPASIKALEASTLSTDNNNYIAVFTQKDPQVENPDPVDDLYLVGTLVQIIKVAVRTETKYHVIIQGVARIVAKEWLPVLPGEPTQVLVSIIPDEEEEKGGVLVDHTHLVEQLRVLTTSLIHLNPSIPSEAEKLIRSFTTPGILSDVIASNLSVPTAKRQEILEAFDTVVRANMIAKLVTAEIAALQVALKIDGKAKGEIEKSQREYYLREQLKAILEELDEDEEGEDPDSHTAIKQRIISSDLPEDIEKVALKELRRLKKMNKQSGEYIVSLTYIDWILDLPWSFETEDNLDISDAVRVFDEDHYGLEKVKDRILEYLSVRQLKADMKGPILCLVGPPGVGKTSLATSVSRALNRKKIRFSLGGMRDEAEIRGHRRTYIGSMPGRIIQGLKKCGSKNPVFILDEIDKVSSDYRGDPAAALLEVLDPEQNNTFQDHYMDLPFDLSKVLFIATANGTNTIPRPLLDRMEIIEVPGYTMEEKVRIANGFIIPEQLEEHGLEESHACFTDDGLRFMIESYTREAGVRNLKREIAAVCRRVARIVAERDKTKTYEQRVIQPWTIEDIRGPIKYINDVAARTSIPGVVTGMAWTAFGGDILFIEATKMPGTGKTKLSGNLGDTMKESVGVAESYVRSIAGDLGVPKEFFTDHDIHIHVPAGGTPKDGPSAGVTMLTAIVSLLTGIPVNSELAMTGEASLRGAVLPVGGIKEKVLAAHRAGIRKVILPEKNRKDWPEIPEEVRSCMEIKFVSRMEEVLNEALGKEKLTAFKQSNEE